MKCDQNLCLHLWYDLKSYFGKKKSTLGSVVPLAMFLFWFTGIDSNEQKWKWNSSGLKKDTSSYASKLNEYQICHRSRKYLPLGKRNWQEINSKMMENIFNFLTVLSHRVFSASFHVRIFILNSIGAPFDNFCKMLFCNTFLGFQSSEYITFTVSIIPPLPPTFLSVSLVQSSL